MENGLAKAALVLPADAAPDEKKATEEIQIFVQQISGAKLEVVTSAQDLQGKAAVFIGGAASQMWDETIRQKGDDPFAFALAVEANQVALRGLSPSGTRVAAYELLEQLGVRWFMPGEIGTVVPEAKTVALNIGVTVQAPSFPSRYHGGSRARGDWSDRMRMGGLRFPSSHGIRYPKEASFALRPELYSLVNGVRVNRQHCISNPEVVQMIVAQSKDFFRKNPASPWIAMGPNDDGGYCECENCRALDGGDFDLLTNSLSMTDRYIWFFNQILAGIEDEFPDKKLAFYAYAEYTLPPVKWKPNPRIVPAMAPITLCRIHGMNNPICPERSQLRGWMQGWKALLPEVYERGYWYNLSDPGLPFSSVHRMRDEIPAGYELGYAGWRTEAVDHWGSETPSLYIAAKLMWNHQADVDALLDDFYTKFFGPAAEPMARYFTMMDAALRDGDFHTGGVYSVSYLYPAKLRNKADAELKAAAQMATNDIYRRRVAMFRMSFDYLQSFIAMREAAFAHDFTSAKAALDKTEEIQNQLIAHDPKLVHERVAKTYLHRFYTAPVKAGYERTTGENKFLAGLSTLWRFTLDPETKGNEQGFYKADFDDSAWKTISSQLSWSDQDMRYYRGEAWYRQKIAVPQTVAGKRVKLWFGGMDEHAEVWLNGVKLGVSPAETFVNFELGDNKPLTEGLAGSGLYAQPFEFDVTDAVRPGQENVVSVRIVNRMVNELGTGGIVGPVMFYVTEK